MLITLIVTAITAILFIGGGKKRSDIRQTKSESKAKIYSTNPYSEDSMVYTDASAPNRKRWKEQNKDWHRS